MRGAGITFLFGVFKFRKLCFDFLNLKNLVTQEVIHKIQKTKWTIPASPKTNNFPADFPSIEILKSS